MKYVNLKRKNYSLLKVFTVIIICYDRSLIEKLESDITLKDSTIAILVNEKSQLIEREQSIRDDKDLTGIVDNSTHSDI